MKDKPKLKDHATYSSKDILLWSLAILLFCSAVWGNYYFSISEHQINSLLRILGVISFVVLAFVAVSLTFQGKSAISFLKSCRTELKKISWASRKETLHTTLIVAVITMIVSLLLWAMDSIIFKLISFITTLGH